MNNKTKLIIISLIISIISLTFFILNIKEDLKIEKTDNVLIGKWNNPNLNYSANVSIVNDKDYNIQYNKNDGCVYNFKRNILNLNFHELVFDLLYLEVLENSCNNQFKNQKIVFKIDKSDLQNTVLKLVSIDELSYLINNINTSDEIRDNLLRLLSLFSMQTQANNQYKNFVLTFQKDSN